MKLKVACKTINSHVNCLGMNKSYPSCYTTGKIEH